MIPLEPFNKVTEKLYQGSVPDDAHAYDGFTMIVLCAQERQPALPKFRGKVLRPAFDDTANPTADEMERARKAASEVGTEIMRGGRVLVTCAAGLNRSGLVTGLALTMTTRMPALEIVRAIRAARGEDALSNPTFHQHVFAAADLRDQVLARRGCHRKPVRSGADLRRGVRRGR